MRTRWKWTVVAAVTTLAWSGAAVPASADLKDRAAQKAVGNAGTGIARDCKADPHALLFALVDTRVRRVAEAGGK